MIEVKDPGVDMAEELSIHLQRVTQAYEVLQRMRTCTFFLPR